MCNVCCAAFSRLCYSLGDVPDLTADPALAEKELGFKAKYNLDDMASSLWNWQSKNPKGCVACDARCVRRADLALRSYTGQ